MRHSMLALCTYNEAPAAVKVCATDLEPVPRAIGIGRGVWSGDTAKSVL